MCGVIDDAFNFVKDSAGEIFSHPGQAAGALFGVPGYDPLIGGLFNNGPNGALLSPTGNFTSSAWNDMYNANPQDSGALGLFHGINSVADKVAPAAAGYFAAPAIGAALGGDTGAAANIGADTFASGVGQGGASTLGGLESGMGGAGLFGAGAGTGTAIGSGVAQGLGAGGLGVADASAMGAGLAGTGGTFTGGLGGATSSGTGLGSLTNGGAALPQGGAGPVDLGGGGASMEGGQAVPMGGGNPAAAGAVGPQQGGDLSSLYGPTSTAAQSPMGSAVSQAGAGETSGITPFGSTLGQTPATSGGAWDYLKSPGGIQDLFKLGQQGLSAYQQYQKGQAAKNYAGQISGLFGPNSPYAQQMQQTLARTDAAAGRNSQYGTRATQLAAALTQAQAQALGGNNYAQAAQNTSGSNVLNGLFGLAGTTTGKNLIGAGFNGLQSLFGA